MSSRPPFFAVVNGHLWAQNYNRNGKQNPNLLAKCHSTICNYIDHISRIFVFNSKKVYTTPYSHQSSLMMYVFENYGYNFYSIMAFWENATFVFWLCQNSWFWVWKKKFSITIFHEKKLPFSVAPFILHLKHWNRAFEAFFVATKVHSATVPM